MRHFEFGFALIVLVSIADSRLYARQRGNGAEIPTPVSVAFLCSNLKGGVISAPDWGVEQDAFSDQQVVVHFKGDKDLSEVTWSRGGNPYYEGRGLGIQMTAGFAIMVLAEDRIETYVYNAGTTELYFGATRSGNTLLPNNVKAYKGTCRPAGSSR